MLILPSLERAVLETLAYSDIFDYPLQFQELHRYLTIAASSEELLASLADLRGRVGETDGFYFLAGRAEIVPIRRERERRAHPLLERARRYGRILGGIPFVRMAALTGSLAVQNVATDADLDYLLVTQAGRLWIARSFAVTFGRLVRPSGPTICVNLIVSEDALAWPRRDLYSAREMAQMLPITGMDVYCRLLAANAWVKSFLPNASAFAPNSTGREGASRIQRLLELPLRGGLGTRLERWAWENQTRRIARRFGAGGETRFSADVCQGNFHGHGQWTLEQFQQRLEKLGVASSLPELSLQDASQGEWPGVKASHPPLPELGEGPGVRAS